MNTLQQRLINGLNAIPSNWVLTPIIKKRPYRSGWQTEEPISRDDLARFIEKGDRQFSERKQKYWTAHPEGYGLRTGSVSGGLLAIDVDGLSALPLLDELSSGDIPKTVSWTSGKPGRKQLLFQLPAAVQSRLETVGFTRDALFAEGNEQLDFRYDRCQSALPPSAHPETGQYKWLVGPAHSVAIAPQWLQTWLLRRCDEIEAAEKDRIARGVRNRELWAQRKDSEGVAVQAINHISPDCSYNTWISIGMACKSLGEQWFDVWDDWSSGGSKYNRREVERNWHSFKGNDADPLGIIFGIAKSYGFRFPAFSKEKVQVEGYGPQPERERERSRQTTEEEIEAVQEIEAFKSKLKPQVVRALGDAKGFGTPKVIPFARRSGSVQRFSSDAEAYAHAIKGGYKLAVNVDGTGSGKTYSATSMKPSDLKTHRLVYVAPDALNPSQEHLKDWSFLEGRHLGTVQDQHGKRRRATIETRESSKVSPANCHAAYAQQQLAAKNTAQSHYSLACARCKFNFMCGKEEGNGYGARHQASKAMKGDRIMASYGRVASDVTENSVTIFDEYFSHSEVTQTIAITGDDITQKWSDISLSNSELAESLKPLFAFFRNQDYTRFDAWNKRHGIALADFDITSVIPELTPLLSEALTALEDGTEEKALFGRTGDNPLSDGEEKRYQKLRKKPGLSHDAIAEMWRLEAKETANKGKLGKDDRKRLKQLQRDHIGDSEVIELEALTKRRDGNKWTPLTPGEMAERANQLSKRWLNDFIAVATRQAPGNIRINPDGSITLAIRETRYVNAIAASKLSIILDASAPRDVEAIALQTGVDASKILIFKTDADTPSNNVKRVQIKGLGSMAKNRGKHYEDGKEHLVSALSKMGVHAHFDWKKYSSDGQLFVDNVGSNKYRYCASISVTPPNPAMGAILDEYVCLTGMVVNVSDEHFIRYYNQRVAEQLYQTEGRLRANRRPDEQLTFYVITDQEMPYEFDETRYSWEFDDRACGKGDRTIIQLAQAMKRLIDAGQDVTQSAVGRLVDVSRQYICKVWDRVQLIFSSLYKKSCTPPDWARHGFTNDAEYSQFIDDLAGIAEAIAPTAAKDEIRDFLLNDVQTFAFQDFWAKLKHETQRVFLDALLAVLPHQTINELVGAA